MVNVGRPSQGCHSCRARRIKCNGVRPECSQCKRLGRPCPGYRDSFAAIFRNETESTKRKALRGKHVKSTTIAAEPDSDTWFVQELPAAPLTASFQETSFTTTALVPVERSPGQRRKGSVVSSTSSSPRRAIAPSLEEKGLCFFVANFVFISQKSDIRGHLQFLPEMMKAKNYPGSTLSFAVEAVAMASFGNRPENRSLLPLAAQQYSEALQMVNKDLQNPKLVMEDETLASVMLLSLFETISISKMKSYGWHNHITGAVELIKLRAGRPQSNAGKLLHLMVRSQMTVHCMATSTSPLEGAEWWIEAGVKDSFTTICARLNLKTAELRAESDKLINGASRTPDGIEKVLQLMRKAQALEEEFVQASNETDPQWHFQPAKWVDLNSDHDLTKLTEFPGRVDSYTELWTATVWNLSRVSRLIICYTILRCTAWLCSPLDYRLTPEYAKLAAFSRNLIDDLIASVPTFLGSQDNDMKLESQNGDSFACGEGSAAGKGLSAVFLLWPLFTVLGSDFASDMQREWVGGRLRFVMENLGIGVAARGSSKEMVRLPSMLIRKDEINAKNPGTAIGSRRTDSVELCRV